MSFKARRGTYICRPSFQIKYSLGSSIFFLVFLLLLGAFTFMELSNPVNTLFQSLENDAPHLVSSVKEKIRLALIYFGAGIFLLTAGVGGFVIYLTHKIAGPLTHLCLRMEQIAKGDLDARVRFRNSDEFHEVADQFNFMIARVREKITDSGAPLEEGNIHSIEKARTDNREKNRRAS